MEDEHIIGRGVENFVLRHIQGDKKIVCMPDDHNTESYK
jgi:hypothetical protein